MEVLVEDVKENYYAKFHVHNPSYHRYRGIN